MKDSYIDFLDFKILLRYMIFITALLVGGWFLKDIVAILISVLILFFAVSKNVFKAIEFWFIWFFVFGFYISQSLIKSDVVFTYLAKPSFLLFVIFVSSYSQINISLKKIKFIKVWLLFIFISVLSLTYHSQKLFVLITISSYLFIYLILCNKKITALQYKKLLNLIIAVAVIQTIVSVLQVSNIISTVRVYQDGTGGTYDFLIEADDAAMGTFYNSFVCSWFQTLIALFLFLVWVFVKKFKYIVFAFIILFQYTVVDSKTVLGITLLMFMYFFYYMNHNSKIFKLNLRKMSLIILLMSVIGFALYSGWNYYYETYYTNESSVGAIDAINTIQNSGTVVLTNIPYWGKFRGFQYVYEDFIKEDYLNLVLGYGLDGYTFNGKMGYIENMDVPFMQLDNITRSRSGFITYFAECGFIGFIFMFLSIFLWYKYNVKIKAYNEGDIVRKALIKIIFPFYAVLFFLYLFSITTVEFIAFIALIAILVNYSKLIETNKNILNEK